METNALLPAIDALKAQVAAKELEIAPLRQQLAAKDAEINPLREMANGLCKLANVPPVFVIKSEKGAAADSAASLKFRPDQFFHKDLSESAVEYLGAKKAADTSGDPTPATTDEIYAALIAHGYTFTGTSEINNNKSALKTALTRNTSQVAKIKDDLYGLRKWYGMRAKYKTSSSSADDEGGQDANDAEKPSEAASAK